jgi:group I intron endonuclease
MENVKSGIYKITNRVNGKYYVGSSKNIRGVSYGRWKTHISKLNNGTHPNAHFQNAWNKYGRHNFIFSIIEETPDLIVREQHYLTIASTELDKCYNLLFSAYRVDMTPDRRKKISDSLKGRFVGSLHPFFGKFHSASARNKISKSQIGRTSPNKGMSMSVLQKEKIRNSLLNKRKEIGERLSKEWEFISPDFKLVKIHNLLNFCKQNNLRASGMYSVFYGKRKHYNGWTKSI